MYFFCNVIREKRFANHPTEETARFIVKINGKMFQILQKYVPMPPDENFRQNSGSLLRVIMSLCQFLF